MTPQGVHGVVSGRPDHKHPKFTEVKQSAALAGDTYRLRPEMTFASVADLKSQIALDIVEAKRILVD